MSRHLLVAYDASPSSEKAFALALELAQVLRADLYVLAVARPPEPADDVETEALIENAKEYFASQLAALSERATAAGVQVKSEIAVGHPAEQIIDRAEHHRIDHIVMGHRGKTFFRRWLLGSVSKQVIDHAHCTVTVVR
jgi:nucleotide-binding universal stress UspA family protein